MSPCELSASITAFANVPAGYFTAGELAVLTQLGDTLVTIASYKELCR